MTSSSRPRYLGIGCPRIAFVSILLALTLVSLTAQVAEPRTALLIANGEYRHFGRLTSPVPEARQLASVLRNLGFSVTIRENASKERMIDALASFERTIKNRGGGIAFFHYGGHAIQIEGKNYLIPTDANIPDELRARTRAVNVDEVMYALINSGSGTNIVVLDACRNNPLPASTRSTNTRGLAPVTVRPSNSIIVYSAESDQVARDGVFTTVLTQAITRQGASFSDILMEVRREVYRRTSGQQTTGNYDQLFEPIYLAGRTPGGTIPPSTIPSIAHITIMPDKDYAPRFFASLVNVQGNPYHRLTNKYGTMISVNTGRIRIRLTNEETGAWGEFSLDLTSGHRYEIYPQFQIPERPSSTIATSIGLRSPPPNPSATGALLPESRPKRFGFFEWVMVVGSPINIVGGVITDDPVLLAIGIGGAAVIAWDVLTGPSTDPLPRNVRINREKMQEWERQVRAVNAANTRRIEELNGRRRVWTVYNATTNDTLAIDFR